MKTYFAWHVTLLGLRTLCCFMAWSVFVTQCTGVAYHWNGQQCLVRATCWQRRVGKDIVHSVMRFVLVNITPQQLKVKSQDGYCLMQREQNNEILLVAAQLRLGVGCRDADQNNLAF